MQRIMKILTQMKPVLLLVTLIFLSVASTKAQVENNINKNTMNSFIAKGNLAPKENFTGTVYVNMNVTPQEGYNINMGTITFEQKARTNWHSHTSGQILW